MRLIAPHIAQHASVHANLAAKVYEILAANVPVSPA